MEQNKSFEPTESVDPVTGQPNTVSTQPAASYTQSTESYTQSAVPFTQPAVQNIQTETHSAQADSHPGKRIVGVIFSAVEIILGLRLILKLLGAAENTFIKILYGTTGFFIKIFEGIFSRVTINGESGAVFEPATLIAMVIIALIALGVLKLMTPRAGSSVVKTDYSGPAGQSGQQK